MQIWSLSHHYSFRYIVYEAGFEEQCQTSNYTSPESPTNHFSVNLYTWSRPNLNKKMVVTSCKSHGLYRIITHADILYTTQALKNNVKLSIIPHPNRPRIIFPSTSIHGHVQKWSRHEYWIRRRLWRTMSNFQLYLIRIAHESKCPNLNKKMVVTSCGYSCRYIVYDAGFGGQCQTFNYTSPESCPNLNKKLVVTSRKSWSLSHHYSCGYIAYDAGFGRTMSNFQLYLTRIAHESFFRQPQYMVTSKIWMGKWWSRHANHVYIASYSSLPSISESFSRTSNFE